MKKIIITRVEKSRKDIATRWRNTRVSETKYREYICDSESDEDIGGSRALGNIAPRTNGIMKPTLISE